MSHAAFHERLAGELRGMEEAGTLKRERVINSAQQREIEVGGSRVLNFCANNYLGLSDDARLIDAAKKSMDARGLGLASVRFICGTQDIHRELEEEIARFHGTEDAILFPSCFDANAGIFEALLGPGDAIFSDALNHASIIDGVRLCKAKKYRYDHMDLGHLERQLQEHAAQNDDQQGTRMIVTDGVFSMDGDIAPLDKLCDLADKYQALVLTDECHSGGFLGATGRGVPELLNCADRVDIINSTLGKAMGGASGGYTAASKEVVGMLRQRARPYLFSNTVAPALVGASLKMFELLDSEVGLERIGQLRDNTARFRSKMAQAGFKLAGSPEHPICPIMVGDAKLAVSLADKMLEKDIYVIGFSFPVVPQGKARVRVQISAAHTEKDIDRAVEAFTEVAKELEIIE